MGSHKNVIEINGKLYDAKSGMLIAPSDVQLKPRPKAPTMDGVIRPQKAAAATTPTPATKPKPQITRAAAPASQRRNTQKSRTLMRHAVKKPATTKVAEPPKIAPRDSHASVSHQRLDRAKTVEKSAYVNKFGSLAHHHPVAKRTELLPVKPVPVHPVQPKPAHTAAEKHHAITPSASEELFNRALAQADHHDTPRAKKRTKRAPKSGLRSQATKWGAGLAAAVLLAGFITYMNLPTINMQLASTQAGIGADMPGYQPTGFKAGAINHKAGQVTIDFNSNTDDRSYTVTQAVSGWNSEALQENFLNARNKEFQTTQDSGRTIYMYDNGNATWVNGGIWYQVESNQALSSDQLLKIASSL